MLDMLTAGLFGGLNVGGNLLGTYLQGEYNKDSANAQMAFQREMSNTQYRRAAEDMEKAGLNRVLALGSPASSPGGASSSIQAPALGDAFTSGVNSASARAIQSEQLGLIRAQQQATAAQADLNSAQAAKTRAETEIVPFQGENLLSQSASNQAGAGRQRMEVQRIVAELPRIAQEIKTSEAMQRLYNANASESEIRRVWEKEAYERLMPFVRKLMDKVESGISGAGGATRLPSKETMIQRFLDMFMDPYDDGRRFYSAPGASSQW